MARARLISDFERDVIRVGVANGRSNEEIGALLGRTRVAIWQHRRAMEQDGTIGNLPLPFVADELASEFDQ